MTRLTAFVLAAMILMGSMLAAQEPATAGPAPAPTLVVEKPFPYAFKTPRPSADELRTRRRDLARAIRNGAAIVVSREKPWIASHRYSPDFNAYYLTGVDTDFCAMTLVAKNGEVADVKLFLPTASDFDVLWNGHRVTAGPEAQALSGIETVVPLRFSRMAVNLTPLEDEVARLAKAEPVIYVDGGKDRDKDFLVTTDRVDALEAALRKANPAVKIAVLGRDMGSPPGSPMAGVRGIKSEWEIGMIREAVRITGIGFVRALRKARPGMWEFEFQAVMDQTFTEFGCTGVPYFPIAASGPNACVYHYVTNNRQAQDGEVVLADIAAQWGYYAADITRSFPVNGKFTPRQRQVYEAVLAGQTAAAAALRPGATMEELNLVACQAMIEAGLKPRELHQHGLGHPVGLNVHDMGDRVLRPGMVVTIEPGAYIKSESLGVRIEDVYLVTAEGSECLSAAIPKTVEAIEAIVGAEWR